MRKVAAAALTDVTAGWDRAQVGEQVLVGGESYLTTSLHLHGGTKHRLQHFKTNMNDQIRASGNYKITKYT